MYHLYTQLIWHLLVPKWWLWNQTGGRMSLLSENDTVWKCKKFSDTEILREINYSRKIQPCKIAKNHPLLISRKVQIVETFLNFHTVKGSSRILYKDVYSSLSNTRTVWNKHTGRPSFGLPVFLFDILLNKNPKSVSNKAVFDKIDKNTGALIW